MPPRVAYQVTIEVPSSGNWIWRNWRCATFHHACEAALAFANARGGHVISIQKLMLDQIRSIDMDDLPS
jgi:hypothetical protein